MLALRPRTLAALAALVVLGGTASAQPGGFVPNPNIRFPAAQTTPRPQARGGVIAFPQVNTLPIQGPMPHLYPPVNPFTTPGAFSNPGIFNPANPAFNPNLVNPLLPNVAFPGVFNPAFGPAVNPVGLNPAFNPGFYNPYPLYGTPPIAARQPGFFIARGPDLRVNPWSGAVYQPYSGVVIQPDGSLFYRVPGTGTPNATGSYVFGSGLYYNPNTGTYFNPQTGVVARPGTPGLLPYVW